MPTAEQMAALEAAGFDWGKLLEILRNPVVAHLIRTLIDQFLAPAPLPVMGATTGHGAPGKDHHAMCLATLQSALNTAALAAEHCCCCEHGK